MTRTRLEEIKEAAEQYGQTYKELVADYDPSQCFIEGATWADIHRNRDSRATESGSVHERIAAAMNDWLKQREQKSHGSAIILLNDACACVIGDIQGKDNIRRKDNGTIQ